MAMEKFTWAEWKQVVNAPALIHHLLAIADRGALFTKRSEAKALETYLSTYKSPSPLVQAIVAGQKEADEKIEAKPDEALKMLEQVGALIEARTDAAEGDAVRDFLLGAGKAIAEAAHEQMWAGGKAVSQPEEKALAAIAVALKATEADKRRRQEAAAAAEAQKRAEAEAQARKQAEAEAQARKQAEEARLAREAEARRQAEQARLAREAEARRQAAEQEAQARKAAEEAAAAKPEALKRKAEEMRREAEALERQAAAAEAAAPGVEPAAAPPPERIYVVKKGDTLSGIAKALYGKAGRWPEIYEANKDRIKDPNLIRPGWKLRIP